jgi:hypothetical protein
LQLLEVRQRNLGRCLHRTLEMKAWAGRQHDLLQQQPLGAFQARLFRQGQRPLGLHLPARGHQAGHQLGGVVDDLLNPQTACA